MKLLNAKQQSFISGAGDPLTAENSELIRQIMLGARWGAYMGVVGGWPGVISGAASGAITPVLQGAASRMPVNVPIPKVPLGPTWFRSRR